MLKWAVTPRLPDDFFEQDGFRNDLDYELLTLPALLEQHELPCLVRLVNDDFNDSIDNYCLLLCETTDPYLIVSNETERFSIPISFDGLFASVERGITRYNVLQSIRSLQSHLKSPSSTTSDFTQFTTLQPCVACSNSSLHRIRPGTILEPCQKSSLLSSSSTLSPPSSSSSIAASRLRTLFANFPHSLNKHFLPNYQQTRALKKQNSLHDYVEVTSNLHDDIFTLKADSAGQFATIYRQIPRVNSSHRSAHSTNAIHGLYTTDLLSQLTDQYPLITELIVSQTLEENVPTTVGYPFRRITVHRLVRNHPRIIAFDMKNYAFIEIDARDSVDMYAIEHDQTLFQRYQAQVRWCHQHLSSFRSQAKTILHSTNGTPMFVQATPLHGQQLRQYYQRRYSSSAMSSPLTKRIPNTIFTSQESISSSRLRSNTPVSAKFYTTTTTAAPANHTSKYEQKRQKGKTTGSNAIIRKDVRIYFNDPTIQKHMQLKHTSFSRKNSIHRMNPIPSDHRNTNEELDNSFQCTAL